MAAGSNGQQNFRKAIAALKDTTMVGMAKVNSEFKELDVAILKATNHVELLPKEKHVRTILGAVSGSRPRADVGYCIHALARRLAKTRTWVVALKTLIIIHRALREVDHSFCEELIIYNTNRGHMLNLLYFKDDSTPSAWDYSTWIRTYALYLEECLECFHVLKFDFYRDHSRTKKFDTPDLLDQLPTMQQLLFRLLACQPGGSARYNFIIQYALSIIATESVRLYVAITDGVLSLVDKFFEMQRRDAVRALEIYRKSGEQAERLSEFFEICRSLEFGRRQKYIKIEQPPPSFLTAMEEYVMDAPQTLTLPWRPNGDESNTTPKAIVVSEDNLESDPKETSDSKAPPLIPDLLSWDEPSHELSENNYLALSLTGPEDLSNPTVSSEASSEPAGWELALVATTSDAPSAEQSKVNNVLDRSTLDHLYDLALTTIDPNTSSYTSNPFESAPPAVYNNNHDEVFYPPNQIQQHGLVVGLDYIPLVGTLQQHQQQGLVIGPDYTQLVGGLQQHPQKEQPIVSQDYMQMAGIPQQQQEASVMMPHQQQEQSVPHQQPITGYDYPQEFEFPLQNEVFVQQEQPTVSQVSANPFGDMFIELGSVSGSNQGQQSLETGPTQDQQSLVPGSPQTQSSNLSLI